MTRSDDEIIAALRAGDAIDAAEAVVYAQSQARPFLERIAELETALLKIFATTYEGDPVRAIAEQALRKSVNT